MSKLTSKGDVIQLYRYPGLSDSAIKTLLRRVRIILGDDDGGDPHADH